MSKLSSFTYDVKREIKEIKASEQRISDLEKEIALRRNNMLAQLHQLEKVADRVAQEFLNNEPGAVWMSNFIVAVVGSHQEIRRLGNGNMVVLVPCNFLKDSDEKTVDGWLEELLPREPEEYPDDAALAKAIECSEADGDGRISGYEAVPEPELADSAAGTVDEEKDV